MKYEILLLDADETLLDFKKAEEQAIRATFAQHGLEMNDDVLAMYSSINQQCWKEFEQGIIDKPTLLAERFRRLFVHLGLDADPNTVRVTYQDQLGLAAFWIDGARELCEELSMSHKIYIVTNGVSATQHSRFAICGLDQLADGVFVSEDVGYQKPRREYFAYVFAQIGEFDPEKVLLVGDSLSADIAGGIKAGMDTCWYNPHHHALPKELNPTYVIDDIRKLREIV
ncbi:MAG: YjjG family noncanonical pyrimidine nucleotidase [Eubacteriales bacterium]|nr:YjjG family noncanonical pyrimidine nucleotidase [Eubacteriales bacterium]